MTTESHGNRIEALIYKLESAAGVCEVEGFDDEADANRKAIEAIRVLTMIAENGGTFRVTPTDGSFYDGQWCAKQAAQFINSIGEK